MQEDLAENTEKDTVEFVAENGEAIELEVVEYFLYDGDEYVILADMGKDPEVLQDGDKVDVFIMKVEAIDDETEEFVPIPAEDEEKVLHFAGHLLNDEGHDHHHHEEELV